MVLHKPLLQTVDMHSQPQGVFMLFNPMTDLVQAKRDAERAQEEEEERKRRLEEEKRRKKEEERRKKEDEKQRRREEEQEKKRAAVAKKAKEKRAEGKGGRVEQAGRQKGDRHQQHQMQVQEEPRGKGKKESNRKKGKKKEEYANFPVPVPNLQAPWVAVTDSKSGRLYYWNQGTNEVTWTPPVPAAPPSRPIPDFAGAAGSDAWNPEFYSQSYLNPGFMGAYIGGGPRHEFQ